MAVGGAAAAIRHGMKKRGPKARAIRDGAPIKEEPLEDHFWARLSRTLMQKQVRAAYLNPNVQWFIASLIMGNFMSNIVSVQL